MAITVHQHIPLTWKICLILLPICFLASLLLFLKQYTIVFFVSSFTVLHSLSAVHHYSISTSSLHQHSHQLSLASCYDIVWCLLTLLVKKRNTRICADYGEETDCTAHCDARKTLLPLSVSLQFNHHCNSNTSVHNNEICT